MLRVCVCVCYICKNYLAYVMELHIALWANKNFSNLIIQGKIMTEWHAQDHWTVGIYFLEGWGRGTGVNKSPILTVHM